MATGVSENVSIGELGRTPPPSDYDGEESFVVLGRSPTSFSFNDDASIILQDALRSLSEEQEQLSASRVEEKKNKDEEERKKEDEIPPPVEANFSSLASLSLEEIQAKVNKMVQENLALKETIQQNNMTMKKQCETVLKWQEDVQKVHDSHKAKFAETKAYIEKLQMENVKLKEDLEKSQSREKVLEEQKRKNSLVEKSSFENVQQFELQTAQKKIEDLELALKKKTEELNSMREDSQKKMDALEFDLQKKTSETDLIISAWESEKKSLQNNICDLQMELDDERAKNEQFLNELGRNRQLSTSSTSVSRSGSAQPEDSLENMRQQLMNAQMHITDLELAKIKYLQVIDEKEREIAKLQKQLVDASSEKDDVHAALRAQLELYKADYEAEVGAKNSLMAEKNQLAEDLQNLQRRNQQLIEEVERLRRDGDFVHVPRPRTAEATSNDAKYACPKCNFKFTNYEALENHVYRCIDLDALP